MRLRDILSDKEDTGEELPPSPDVAYYRWSTEVEPQLEPDRERFNRQHRNLIRAVNKFAPLAFITSRKMFTITELKRLKIDLLEECGLHDLAERESLHLIALYNESRGWTGFFTKAMVTQRQVLEQKFTSDRKPFRRGFGLFKKRVSEEEKAEEEGF